MSIFCLPLLLRITAPALCKQRANSSFSVQIRLIFLRHFLQGFDVVHVMVTPQTALDTDRVATTSTIQLHRFGGMYWTPTFLFAHEDVSFEMFEHADGFHGDALPLELSDQMLNPRRVHHLFQAHRKLAHGTGRSGRSRSHVLEIPRLQATRAGDPGALRTQVTSLRRGPADRALQHLLSIRSLDGNRIAIHVL